MEDRKRLIDNFDPVGARSRFWTSTRLLLALLGVVVVVVVVTVSVVLTRSDSDDSGDDLPPVWSDIRLPSFITPSSYQITVQPNLVTAPYSFTGSVSITLQISQPTSDIVVHMANLNIDTVQLIPDGAGFEFVPDDVVFNTTQEYVVFRFYVPSVLRPGKYLLIIGYHGLLGQDLLGFYNSSYVDPNGATSQIATTKFEPTYARRAFPCLDEPAFKATFEVIAITNTSVTPIVLSNMPEVLSKRETLGPNLEKRYFEPSFNMSTYLVAFIFCNFSVSSLPFHGDKNVSVWVRPDALSQGLFSLSLAQNCTSFYESYFEIDFPLPKMDLIGIPDFISGAMENWGLITFRETSFLVDSSTASASDKQRTALTVCHELAHQWFGDLVTMKWWNDLWLNEGFASFLEYESVAHAFPDWQMDSVFITDNTMNAFDADSLPVTHAISVNITNPAQINSLFDSISYDKGAAILRMLSYYLDSTSPGPSVFRAGLASYLGIHKYSNAATADLWQSLSSASGQPVATIMSAWTDSEGFPFVSVAFTSPTTLVLTQQRYYQFPTSTNTSTLQANDQLWWIPVDYISNDNSTAISFPLPLVKQSSELSFNTSGNPAAWIKFNVGQNGVYRTLYSPKLLQALKDALLLDRTILSPSDRSGLVSDTLSFMRSNYLPVRTALDFLQVLKNETNYVVWSGAIRYFSFFEPLLRLELCYGDYKQLIQDLIQSALAYTGGVPNVTAVPSVHDNPQSHLDVLLRAAAIDTAAKYGHLPTMLAARALFFADDAGTVSISSDLRGAVYNAAVASDITDDGDTVWRTLNDRYDGVANDPTERNRIISAMARSPKPYILNQVLKFTLISTKVRVQDVISVMVNVAANPQGQTLTWNFFKQNFDFFRAKFGERMASLVTGLTKDFTMSVYANEIQSFFTTNPVPSAALAIQQGVQRVQSNELWISQNAAETCAYLFSLS